MVYVTIRSSRYPTSGTAAEIAFKHGIEALRNVPLKDGNSIVYIHQNLITKIATDYANPEYTDNPTQVWKERCYGGLSPNASMVSWINLNTVYPLVTPVL